MGGHTEQGNERCPPALRCPQSDPHLKGVLVGSILDVLSSRYGQNPS